MIPIDEEAPELPKLGKIIRCYHSSRAGQSCNKKECPIIFGTVDTNNIYAVTIWVKMKNYCVHSELNP